MKINLKPLTDKRAGFVQERQALLDKAVGEARGLTDDERASQEKLAGEIKRMDELITMAQAPSDESRGGDGPEPSGEIRTFGELLYLARFAPQDPRLRVYEDNREHRERRDMSMGVGSAGGFLVPEQFGPMLAPIQPGEAIFRPRARVIPAGNPPDAAITMPALDQSGANGVFGGVQVSWIAEAATKPQTEPIFSEVKLEPHEVAAHIVVSDKLLRNHEAAGSLIGTLLRNAIFAAEDQAFLNGSGVGQPLGIIGHPAAITVARTGAGAIVYADIVAMYARALFGGSLAWIASQSVLPQLMTMVGPGAGAPLVWQPNAAQGTPGTLMGFPVLLNTRSPVLGSPGDLMLVDLRYYLIKDGSPLTVAASEHPRFVRNQTIIKAWWNVDGQPWLTTPLLLEDGVSTVSPFVVLL